MRNFLKTLVTMALSLGCIAVANAEPGLRAEGPRGKFKVAKGADLRILDDNIWDYSKDTIPPAWRKLGEDPRDSVKAAEKVLLIA